MSVFGFLCAALHTIEDVVLGMECMNFIISMLAFPFHSVTVDIRNGSERKHQ